MGVLKYQVTKTKTNIEGFDHIAMGGLPTNRTTLVSGTAGSAKTLFAVQFLAEGITKADENGVFITFEEAPDDIYKNMAGFKWNIRQWEDEGKWKFIDASPQVGDEVVISGNYDFGALIARIEYSVSKVKAKRVSMDSLGAIFNRYEDKAIVRKEIFRLVNALKKMNVTAIITAERTDEYGEIGRYGVEEFVTDNVVILRNVLEDEKRRRTVEILKLRGTQHHTGECPFTINEKGIIAIPLSAIQLEQKSSNKRITSGVPELDKMCGGGIFRDSVILASGATGTGKTLMSSHFIYGGTTNNERCLLFAYEESREQLLRNAIGWGLDLEKMEKKGLLQVEAIYPETASIEGHLLRMQEKIDKFKPTRVAVDSLSALERVASIKGFREFVIGLTCFLKEREITGFLTSTTPTLMGGPSITEGHISTITDLIIMLRYVEAFGEMRRGITVLKMRGSMHDKSVKEFAIDHQGMHIGKPFRDVVGIIAGRPTYVERPTDIDRMKHMFDDSDTIENKPKDEE